MLSAYGKMICLLSQITIGRLPVIYTDICRVHLQLNFLKAQRCVFHQIRYHRRFSRNIFPDGFADSNCSGASFYGQKRSANLRLERAARKRVQSGTLPKNTKFTAYFDNQWPAPVVSTDEGKAGQK